MRGVGAERNLYPLTAAKPPVAAKSRRKRMAYDAARREIRGLPEKHLAVLRVAVWQLRAGGQRAAAERELSGQRETGRQRVADGAERIGREAHGRQKIPELLHFIGRQGDRRALQIREGGAELFDAITIAAPVKRFMADDVLQGLRRHRAFHRMKMIRDGGRGHEVGVGDELHPIGRLAQIPREPVEARVHMARAARGLPESGSLMGVVKVRPAELDGLRRGIQK